MQEKLSIGYSPCPNDTYIFYGLMHGKIPLQHCSFAEPLLEDVETLNRWALEARLDVTKLSFHALGHVLDEYVMLSSGAALGRGCGPLLVVKAGNDAKIPLKEWRIAIPGAYTTAAMLLQLYAQQRTNLKIMRFEKIMDAVAEGEVDAGVIIHESRFTYREKGLQCMQDLGAWWEEQTGLPIPLGCIAARRSLGEKKLREIEKAIRESVVWASDNFSQCMGYIRTHAQEMDEKVIASHIDLYVNQFSHDVGEVGREAVQELLRRGRNIGLFQPVQPTPWLS